MDPTTLRIILIIVGLASLLGLYLWERRRGQRGAARRTSVRPTTNRMTPRREPSLELDTAPAAGAQELPPQQPLTPDPLEAPSAMPEPRLDTDTLHLDLPHPPDLEGDSRTREYETEPLLIQIFVIARDGHFLGSDILHQARALGLEAGEMDIFHRYTPAGALQDPLYSMANLVKPGSFPFDDIQGFETPGLALFCELHGEPSDLMVFDELLGAANQLAEQLNGELRGADREPLDESGLQRLRNQVSEALEEAEARRLG